MIRRLIEINVERCNGCGACVKAIKASGKFIPMQVVIISSSGQIVS